MIRIRTEYLFINEFYQATLYVYPDGSAKLEAYYLPDNGHGIQRDISGRLRKEDGKWELVWAKGSIDAFTGTGKGMQTNCPEAERTWDSLPKNSDDIAALIKEAFLQFIEKKGYKPYDQI